MVCGEPTSCTIITYAMKKQFVANWKMNPGSVKEALGIARASDYESVIVCPPFPFIPAVSGIVKRAELGAQDLFWERKGAYTGEVSSLQLRGLGVRYVIIGHSERRYIIGETDEVVEKKFVAALRAGLVPIVCVGETAEEKRAGRAEEAVMRELRAMPARSRFVVAYEPVWAIGTGIPDRPEDTERMVRVIRSRVPRGTSILYGGSVTAANLRSFCDHSNIDGVLVGGASIRIHELRRMIHIIGTYDRTE